MDVATKTIKNGFPNMHIGNLGVTNDINQTPLTVLASNFDNSNIIEWALENGCDPNIPRYWGDPSGYKKYPLELSLECGDIKSVEVMLLYGANVHKINLDRTMFYVILMGGSDSDKEFVETFKFLLDHGAKLDARVVDGITNEDLLKERWTGKRLEKAIALIDKNKLLKGDISRKNLTSIKRKYLKRTKGCRKLIHKI